MSISITVTAGSGATQISGSYSLDGAGSIDVTNKSIPKGTVLSVSASPNTLHMTGTQDNGTIYTAIEMEDGPGGGGN